MCSDAQFSMREPGASTREEQAFEMSEPASPDGGEGCAEPAPASEPGIGRAVGVCLGVARAWGESLIRLLRHGRKDRANFRKNALSHARRQPAD